MSGSSEEDSNSDIEVELEGSTFTLLTEMVRNQYLMFLKRQLDDNLKTCWHETDKRLSDKNHQLNDALVHKCAQNLEDLAIKEATLTQLYQRAMLKMIARVRCCTKECRIFDELPATLDEVNCKSNVATKATQTDNIEDSPKNLTLDERINKIFTQKQLSQTSILENKISTTEGLSCIHRPNGTQKRTSESQRKQYEQKRLVRASSMSCEGRTISKPLWHSPTPPPPAKRPFYEKNIIIGTYDDSMKLQEEAQLAGDEIAEELEKLFSEPVEADFEEVFGISLENLTKKNNTPNEVNKNDVDNGLKEIINAPATTLEKSNESSAQKANQTYRPPVDDLRHSPWPCECFMQKRRLSVTLNRLVEEDFRWMDIVKTQFSFYFGDFGDPNEDFAQCSPSLEVDEIINSSSVRRISPWVVKHLMKPLDDGLIGNRFLFKKLAKKLAHHIITENQYPDEFVIKNAIESFFCLHRAVMTADDFNDIDAIPIADACTGLTVGDGKPLLAKLDLEVDVNCHVTNDHQILWTTTN